MKTLTQYIGQLEQIHGIKLVVILCHLKEEFALGHLFHTTFSEVSVYSLKYNADTRYQTNTFSSFFQNLSLLSVCMIQVVFIITL